MYDGNKEIEEVEEENFHPSLPQRKTQSSSLIIPSSSSSGHPHKRVTKTKSIQVYEKLKEYKIIPLFCLIAGCDPISFEKAYREDKC